MTVVQSTGMVAGRYRLVSRIATGGMGDVWRAEDELLGRQVAVKFLKPEFAADGSFRLRFRAEARASASLSHPGVATVFDYGEEVMAGGVYTAYLVMELVPGEPLSAVLARESALGPARTLDVVAQTASALQAAHDRGIVHRDVKPANLLVRTDGRIKITDFGIARAADAMALTQTGAILGTVAYLSPEQLSGQTATPASDLYSLGVVAYLCLAGHTPFACGQSVAVAVAQVRQDVPPLPGTVPSAVQELVYRLMDKNPAQRPRSAAALAAAATQVRDQLVVRPSPPTTRASPVEVLPLAGPSLGPVRRLPTARPTTATEVMATPLGGDPRDPRPGTGSTLLAPGHDRTHDRGAHRRSRWGTASFLAAVVVLGVALGLWASKGPVRAASDSPPRVLVPQVEGTPVSTATPVLTKAGFRISQHNVDGTTPPGEVIGQSPAANTRVRSGTAVTLAVSSGYVDLASTGLIGQQYASVATSLSDMGLQPSRQDTVSDTAPGTVLDLSPSGRVPIGTTIAVSVAVPPVRPTVPTTTRPTVPVTTAPTRPTVPATTAPTTPTPSTAPDTPGQPGDHGKGHSLLGGD
ncbi:MAG: protein kinase [Acidimicrobiales bacterium]